MAPLIQLLMAELPDIIARIKAAHASQNPDAPSLTSQQVMDALELLFNDSVAKDEALKVVLQAEIDAQQ